jgi:hypothetical protein
VILTAKSSSASSLAAQSAILETIWGADGSGEGGGGMGLNPSQVHLGGSVWVHGREVKEWNKSALRSRIAYMKDNELDIPLPAG